MLLRLFMQSGINNARSPSFEQEVGTLSGLSVGKRGRGEKELGVSFPFDGLEMLIFCLLPFAQHWKLSSRICDLIGLWGHRILC